MDSMNDTVLETFNYAKKLLSGRYERIYVEDGDVLAKKKIQDKEAFLIKSKRDVEQLLSSNPRVTIVETINITGISPAEAFDGRYGTF